MAVASTTAKFHQNFWGEENSGFEVLMQNMRAGITASKELGEFIRERMVTEDSYVKGLSKLHKAASHIPASTLGTFGPLWEVLQNMCEKLVEVHSKFVEMLGELSKEIGEYHHSQKEKLKQRTRGDIERAQESLGVYQSTESSVAKSLKHYQQCVDHLAKAQGKLEKARADAATNPKAKLRINELEGRVTQATQFMESVKSDHQATVKKHCGHLMEFQGKMSEACVKFESVEEEHLAQMVTFMIKIARTQDTTHVGVAEVFSTLNSELDFLTVEKLLKDFVAAKGTGQDKPAPHKFKPIPVVVPAVSSLAGSTEDISAAAAAAAAAGAGERRGSKGIKKTKKLFKKKGGKQSVSVDAGGGGSNGPVEASLQGAPGTVPEVDEEGYSIRPDDAASISRFPDDPGNKRDTSDSDSDFDDEPESKIKTIKIRESSNQPVASVDDIKASVMSMRLGTISPIGIRKATSSQSLNILSVTPPGGAKISAATSSHSIKDSVSPSKNAISLMDIDMMLSDTANTPPTMPDPLLPAGPPSSKFQPSPAPLIPISASPTIRRASEVSHIPSPLVPTPALNTGKSSPVNLAQANNNKPIDVAASLPAWGNFPPFSSTPPPLVPAPSLTPVSAGGGTSTSSSGSGLSLASSSSPFASSPVISRPRAGSLKDLSSTTGAQSSGGGALPAAAKLNSIPAPPVPSKRRSSGARVRAVVGGGGGLLPSPPSPPSGRGSPNPPSSSTSSTTPTPQPPLTPTPVPSTVAILKPVAVTPSSGQEPGTAGKGGSSSGGSRSVGSSPTFGRKMQQDAPEVLTPAAATTKSGGSGGDEEEETRPIPTPRGASLLHSSGSPLPPSSSSSSSSSQNPISPPHNPPANGTPISPLAMSQITAHPQGASANPNKVMPLAVAIHETCNAIFKGASLENCLVKVTGEIVMSFPASFLPMLGSYEPLRFRVVGGAAPHQDMVQRMLHNQHLIKKSESGEEFTFEMGALTGHLKKMQEKASAPFYNVQILKYDVNISDGTKLPLQLVAYMKCEPSITNFRLDYTYQPSVFQSSPTLTKVVFSVPIDGGVKNALTKPIGKWSAETNRMTWNIGDIPPSDKPVPTPLHAKFDVGSGPSTPSTAMATFFCEGATLSGMEVQLESSMYRVSLMKKKCSSGKYEAEPKTTT